MLKSQQELNFSQYTNLYDKLSPQNHLFRKINELIDFSFIRDELKDKYCPDNGRTAEDPEYLFKFLFLKCLHPMSDVDLVERALYDLSYKYFLGLNPEDEVINASTLSKFRKLRLKDTELLDLLIEKTVQIAMDKGIIESKSIIVDATHTKSRYNRHPILVNISVLQFLKKNGASGVIYDDYSKVQLVVAGGEPVLVPDTYSYFSLMCIAGDVSGVTIKNAKYPLEKGTITSDYQYGVSNEVLPGQTAEVTLEKGVLLLVMVW